MASSSGKWAKAALVGSCLLLFSRVLVGLCLVHAGSAKITDEGVDQFFQRSKNAYLRNFQAVLNDPEKGGKWPKAVKSFVERHSPREQTETTDLVLQYMRQPERRTRSARQETSGLIALYLHAFPYAQFVLGAALLLGLVTRFTSALAILLVFVPAGLALMVWPYETGGRLVLGVHYYIQLVALLALLLACGAGRFSVDGALRRWCRAILARRAALGSVPPPSDSAAGRTDPLSADRAK